MKKVGAIFLFIFLFSCLLYGQITQQYNGIRIGDVIIKQEVIYTTSGESGRGVIWDFTNLATINEEYTLEYLEPGRLKDSIYVLGDNHYKTKDFDNHELIIGVEHNTMYYYIQKSDSLRLLGHENSAIQINYNTPITELVYPLNVGTIIKAPYVAKGLYSGTDSIEIQGTIQTAIDAIGSLILPQRDTLSPVIRTRTQQFIEGLNSSQPSKLLNSYKWYTKGYRYPIFETITSFSLPDSTEIFSTAFYYPIQDHYYLETDPENQDLLDDLWNIDDYFSLDNYLKTDLFSDFDLPQFKVYPNPVKATLNIEYIPQTQSPIDVFIYSSDGRLVKQLKVDSKVKKIDFSYLNSGVYILKLVCGKDIRNEKIIKE